MSEMHKIASGFAQERTHWKLWSLIVVVSAILTIIVEIYTPMEFSVYAVIVSAAFSLLNIALGPFNRRRRLIASIVLGILAGSSVTIFLWH